MTRRGVVAVAGLAAAGAVLFNVPAQAVHEVCGPLQASYIANPESRAQLLGPLSTFGCTVPNTGSSTSSSSTSTSTSTPTSTSTSTSTTSTTPGSTATGCAGLQSAYLADVNSRPVLLPLLLSLGCSVPGSSTTSSSTSSTTSSSTTSSTTSTSTSTSTTVVTTIPADAGCASLLLAYNAAPETQSQFLPVLQALGCTVPNGSSA